MDLFELRVPTAPATPVIVEVPHAGLEVPEEVASNLAVGDADLRRDADLYADEVYAEAPSCGATMLVSRLSRYVVDLNRDPDDVDAAAVEGHPHPRPEAPRGFLWRVTTDGQIAMRRPLTIEQWRDRVERYWRPYHDVLKREIDRLRERFGTVLLVAGHTMPSVGRSTHGDPGRRRADVVPGTRGRTSCDVRIADLVDRFFRERGYRVTPDDPYRGGHTTAHYGEPPKGVHAIQIEVSRSLYMDESTFDRKPDGLSRLRSEMAELLGRLGEHVGRS